MPSSDVRVRRAGAGDVDRVAPLFGRYLRFYGKPHDEATAVGFVRARMEQGQSVVLLAELGGTRTVGFTQLYPSFSSVSLAPTWILNDLYVLESARGDGVAAALMEAAERLARDAGAVSLTLETGRDNHTAQRLYERQGYRVDDRYLHYEKRLA